MPDDDILIRSSSAPELNDCPRRWAARSQRELIEAAGYTLRRTPTHIGAPIGTGTHALAACLLVAKRDGLETTFMQARDVGLEALRVAMNDAGDLTTDATANDLNDAERQVTRMGVAYADQILPQVEPLLIEQNLYAAIEPGFVLKGQLDDLVTLSGKSRLRDTKTGNTPTGVIAQLGCYSLLCETHGHKVEGLDVDFIKRVPLKKLQPAAKTYTIDLPAAEAAAESALTTAIASVKRFRQTSNPASFRANPSSKLCSSRFCPAHSAAGGFCTAHFPTEPEPGEIDG